MSPLSDKELKGLLNKKMSSIDPLPTDHLWSGIEGSLPTTSSSGIAMMISKIIVYVGLFTSMMMSDSSKKWIEAAEREETTIEDNEYIPVHTSFASLVPLDFALQTGQNIQKDYNINLVQYRSENTALSYVPAYGRKLRTRSVHPVSISKVQSSNHVTLIKRNSHEPSVLVASPSLGFEKSDIDQYEKEEEEFNSLLLQSRQPSIGYALVGENKIVWPADIKRAKRNASWFYSISSYLTYHKLEPSPLDEIFLVSDLENSPSVQDRVGVRLDLGRNWSVSPRVSFQVTSSLEYYSSEFYFLIANNVEPNVYMQNRRVDLGLSIGLNYRLKGLMGNDVIGIGLGGKQRLVDLSNSDQLSYNSSLFSYRAYYLTNLGNWQVGPSFSSLLSSKDYAGYGRIIPSSYGVVFRKNFGK